MLVVVVERFSDARLVLVFMMVKLFETGGLRRKSGSAGNGERTLVDYEGFVAVLVVVVVPVMV